MVNVILSHEVKDFSSWRKLFDAGESMRTQAGIKTTGVYTSVDNQNQVTVLAEFPSAEIVQGFLNNPELRKTMEEAGVIGKPDIKILNRV
ncbi:MAG TPA: hypothetical protein VF622_04465 [Segetibacter sp.]